MRLALILIMMPLVLAGCSTVPRSTPPATASKLPNAGRDLPAPDAPARAISARGLESVIGKDSAALIRLFGEPRLNIQEANGRKLQFSGTVCILDAYLYPPQGSGGGGNGTEIVTHVDARRRDGAEVDRAACVNALIRR